MKTNRSPRSDRSPRAQATGADAAQATSQPGDLLSTLQACRYGVIDQHVLPGRDARLSPVPGCLHPAIRSQLETLYPDGIYSHQAAAIEDSIKGRDVCVATSTASGKSLVYMAVAAHEVLSDPQARVLALYPARALIQDQLEKWSTLLEPLGIRPGFIDGSIPMAQRQELLQRHRVMLMTPDVTQAWLMGNLNAKAVATFRRHLRLAVLDETHVYDGEFGTNMAFFLRRLQVVTAPHRLICTTATLGEPAEFIRLLTGRDVVAFSGEDDGARFTEKTLVLTNPTGTDSFDSAVGLLVELARSHGGRFLVFADSRIQVETLTAACHRELEAASSPEVEGPEHPQPTITGPGPSLPILPYRAGYESKDRREIQASLAAGRLRGVVSTSALELGLDIGEIDLVLLLDTPPSMKSFWQRLGRAGRREPGTCVIIDSKSAIGNHEGVLAEYLKRPVEPNRLYVQNRYIQFTNALCAAQEIAQVGTGIDLGPFDSLPDEFRRFVDNELNPIESVAQDLYPLKQAGQAGPHREFPLRNGIEKNFRVITQHKAAGSNIDY